MNAKLFIAAVICAQLDTSSLGNQALAQEGPPCGPRTEMLSALADKYGETTTGVGLESRGGLVELLTNEDAGTWTLIVSGPDGRTCIVASGLQWITKPEAKGASL